MRHQSADRENMAEIQPQEQEAHQENAAVDKALSREQVSSFRPGRRIRLVHFRGIARSRRFSLHGSSSWRRKQQAAPQCLRRAMEPALPTHMAALSAHVSQLSFAADAVKPVDTSSNSGVAYGMYDFLQCHSNSPQLHSQPEAHKENERPL